MASNYRDLIEVLDILSDIDSDCVSIEEGVVRNENSEFEVSVSSTFTSNALGIPSFLYRNLFN